MLHMEDLRGRREKVPYTSLKVCLHRQSETQTQREDEGQFVRHRVFKGSGTADHCHLRYHPEINLQARNPFCSTFSTAILLLS